MLPDWYIGLFWAGVYLAPAAMIALLMAIWRTR